MGLLVDAALFAALSAAFLLGVGHSFEPDHLVAVSTIVTQRRGVAKSLLTGSYWGLGHTVVLLLAGLFVIILKIQFLIYQSQFFEFGVGVMLIILGVWTIRNVKQNRLHFHAHEHQGKIHSHFHSHPNNSESHDHRHLPFWVGVVHGLAGGGGLVILAMSTMVSFIQALLFMVAFGGGTILGMSMFGSALSLPLTLDKRWSYRIGSVASVATGILSVLLGLVVIAGNI